MNCTKPILALAVIFTVASGAARAADTPVATSGEGSTWSLHPECTLKQCSSPKIPSGNGNPLWLSRNSTTKPGTQVERSLASLNAAPPQVKAKSTKTTTVPLNSKGG
jgi:hypothetical protein